MTPPSETTAISVDLNGYGNVGRALVPLLRRHDIRLGSIRTSSEAHRRRGRAGRRIFVDATSPRYDGPLASRWVDRVEAALTEGTAVVTCNKAPLALEWERLVAAAGRGHTTLSCSGTVGGGTPLLPFLRRLHRSQGIVRIDAACNATLNYVCDRVSNGVSIADALGEAQRAGFAEPDPVLDLDGTDLYAKSVIVHNLLFADRRALALDAGRPRLRLDAGRIRRLARAGRPPRVVSTISPGRIVLGLRAVPASEPPNPEPATASVRAVLKDGSAAGAIGPGAGPRATAGALLADLLDLAGDRIPWRGGVRP